MEVILLKPNRKLGKLGDKVKVKAGFGRNYLIPQGQAVPATEANLEYFEKRRSELEGEAQKELEAAQARLEAVKALTLTLSMKAGDEGKLFGSVGTRDIANLISEAGVKVEKSEVSLPAGTLRQVGEYDVSLQLHSDVSSEVKITIVPE